MGIKNITLDDMTCCPGYDDDLLYLAKPSYVFKSEECIYKVMFSVVADDWYWQSICNDTTVTMIMESKRHFRSAVDALEDMKEFYG